MEPILGVEPRRSCLRGTSLTVTTGIRAGEGSRTLAAWVEAKNATVTSLPQSTLADKAFVSRPGQASSVSRSTWSGRWESNPPRHPWQGCCPPRARPQRGGVVKSSSAYPCGSHWPRESRLARLCCTSTLGRADWNRTSLVTLPKRAPTQ